MARTKSGDRDDPSARERILLAAERLFAELGFTATPTSRIAEVAGVPKGLVHYYFRRKRDLLTALVGRLPDERIDVASVAVPGDLAESLRRLVAEHDRRLSTSRVLSHLLWREADTHRAVRDALRSRHGELVRQVRAVIVTAAGPNALPEADVDGAAALVALAVGYRHSMARHEDDASPGEMERELEFIANALTARAATAPSVPGGGLH
ncbi:TetR family transcriptional regulator [Prauserella shujinwangii]|uniref:TetR family transcriptional regulator n=1 Tax=Prauserella shujinwangii TaxID=1453103 RepID=A0A2T0LZ94_9PSEU|nr:TetR/AcrR family transcriptional regulator [Prauserella shujinwangii]PRX49437.1 TetR family transcriptional regulator [Prauserella shujinwangii]